MEGSEAAVAAAYSVCALASYGDVTAMLARTGETGTAGLMLAGTARQCEGDLLRAESALRRAADRAAAADRPYVIDLLAPLLVSRGMFARAAAAIAAAAPPTRELEIGRLALSSVVHAATGAARLSGREAYAARDALAGFGDDALRVRVHQRLALSAHYRGRAAAALDEVRQGIQAAHRLRVHRPAAGLHAVAHATHTGLTGDADAAWSHALALAHEAALGGDEPLRALARAAIYELAAERGDDARLAAARAEIQAHPLPERYHEQFGAGVADALRLAWSGDPRAARNALCVVKDATGRSHGERALCRALLALIAVALGDDDAARRFTRQARAVAAHPALHLPAPELRYRRIARALATAAGDLDGAGGRTTRAAETRLVRRDAQLAALLDVRSSRELAHVPAAVRGYARLIAIAREQVSRRPTSGPLTETETEIVRLVACGRNAPQIAEIMNRSPHTVRTHLRNARAKLDAHGRLELVARARTLGVLGASERTVNAP
ncbi:MAG TPA: helix-turn-helix transcriptional regulator [Candidatus Elarobacter sp.]|jgi:DNA-binding CsgD family transcriptional regulator